MTIFRVISPTPALTHASTREIEPRLDDELKGQCVQPSHLFTARVAGTLRLADVVVDIRHQVNKTDVAAETLLTG